MNFLSSFLLLDGAISVSAQIFPWQSYDIIVDVKLTMITY